MKILHYTLGFSPQRTGGLISYVNDIINEQIKHGNEVVALYPANQHFFGKKIKIRKNGVIDNVIRFELINSLPLPLFGGISNPEEFMIISDEEVYLEFLQEISPDIIHIHSLMGLHLEFFKVARKLGIKIFFTTHDYFGLAPIPTFYYNGISFDDSNTNYAWNIMSADALSVRKLRLFQSNYYEVIRHIMKLLNKNPKHKCYKEISDILDVIDFSNLRAYYQEIFSYVDCFLFNSSVSKAVYERNISQIKQGEIVHVSYTDINSVSEFENKGFRVGYIGPDEDYKGYFDFLALASNNKESKYVFLTFGHYPNQFAPEYVIQKGRFSKHDRQKVFAQIDYLIVPSKWKETFGLIVVEAIQYGVSVIVTTNVGAKDLLSDRNIVEDIQMITDFSVFEKTVNSNISTLDVHVMSLQEIYRKYGEL